MNLFEELMFFERRRCDVDFFNVAHTSDRNKQYKTEDDNDFFFKMLLYSFQEWEKKINKEKTYTSFMQ